MSPTRRRLDLEIVRRGLAPSRERAQALILAGRVRVFAVERPKAGATVTDTEGGPWFDLRRRSAASGVIAATPAHHATIVELLREEPRRA